MRSVTSHFPEAIGWPGAVGAAKFRCTKFPPPSASHPLDLPTELLPTDTCVGDDARRGGSRLRSPGPLHPCRIQSLLPGKSFRTDHHKSRGIDERSVGGFSFGTSVIGTEI